MANNSSVRSSARRRRRHIAQLAPCLPLLLLFLHRTSPSSSAAASTSSSSTSSSSTSSSTSSAESIQYSKLPPTVFAPGGRLHGVERAAREAFHLWGDDDDATSSGAAVSPLDGYLAEECSYCGVLAFRCGVDDGDGDGDCGDGRGGSRDGRDGSRGEEFGVMVGVGAVSPHLHRDDDEDDDNLLELESATERVGSAAAVADEDPSASTTSFAMPLTIVEAAPTSSPYSSSSSSSIAATPLSILSASLVVGAGGKAVDSMILQRRAVETALRMHSRDVGGVDWFASHSLEGTAAAAEAAGGDRCDIAGGASGVDAAALSRRIADAAQSSTQSLGSRHGRMLSSSLLAMGTRRGGRGASMQVDDIDGHRDGGMVDDDRLVLWRVDPTGQFWRVDASAVGRCSANVESELLRRAREWKAEREQHRLLQRQQRTVEQRQGPDKDDTSNDEGGGSGFDALEHDDVRSYLASLSVDDAVDIATDCLVNGIMSRSKRRLGSKLSDQLEKGLRRRVQVLVLRSD